MFWPSKPIIASKKVCEMFISAPVNTPVICSKYRRRNVFPLLTKDWNATLLPVRSTDASRKLHLPFAVRSSSSRYLARSLLVRSSFRWLKLISSVSGVTWKMPSSLSVYYGKSRCMRSEHNSKSCRLLLLSPALTEYKFISASQYTLSSLNRLKRSIVVSRT